MLCFRARLAIRLDAASFAERFAGFAYITPVEQKPMVRFGDQLRRDILHELPLRFQRRFAIGSQPYAL